MEQNYVTVTLCITFLFTEYVTYTFLTLFVFDVVLCLRHPSHGPLRLYVFGLSVHLCVCACVTGPSIL